MTTQPKLTRRQFLTTLAAAAAGALVAGVVKVEPEPAEWDDISAKPLGPQYLLEDNFDGDPVGGVRTVMDWDAREDVRGIDMTLGSWHGSLDVQFDYPGTNGTLPRWVDERTAMVANAQYVVILRRDGAYTYIKNGPDDEWHWAFTEPSGLYPSVY